ncbi:MAG: aspartyl protease family protein [Patescibacteria group bacterium]
MKFSYKKYPQDILRPVIRIEVKSKNQPSVPYEVLVDSGADFCIFDAGIAEILNIDLESGEPRNVAGVTGVQEVYYVHPVTLLLGGWEYQTEVGFMPGVSRFGHGIVGQIGFFDQFKVKFDYQKAEVELMKK